MLKLPTNPRLRRFDIKKVAEDGTMIVIQRPMKMPHGQAQKMKEGCKEQALDDLMDKNPESDYYLYGDEKNPHILVVSSRRTIPDSTE